MSNPAAQPRRLSLALLVLVVLAALVVLLVVKLLVIALVVGAVGLALLVLLARRRDARHS